MLEAAFEVGSLVATRRFLRPNPGPEGGIAKAVMDKGTVGIVIGIQQDLITVDFGATWDVKAVEARHLEVLGKVGSHAEEQAVEADLVALVAQLSAENATLRAQLEGPVKIVIREELLPPGITSDELAQALTVSRSQIHRMNGGAA